MESHTIQKLFGGQDKTIFIISEHFDGIPSFITKDKNIRALIWIELELHTDQGSQTLYLFAEIRSSTCKIDMLGFFSHMPHHNCFRILRNVRSDSGRIPSGKKNFISWQTTMT